MDKTYWNSIPLLRTILIVANTACAIFWLLLVFESRLFTLMPVSRRGVAAAVILATMSLVLVAVLAGMLGQRKPAMTIAWALVAMWCWGGYQITNLTNMMQLPWLLAIAACGGLSVMFTAYALSVRREV